jgi:small neutral amino acid transporter SnatA (MarC family)
MAVVLMTDNNAYSVRQEVETAALLVVVLGFTYGCLVGADFVQRLLGSTRCQCREPHHGADLGGARGAIDP